MIERDEPRESWDMNKAGGSPWAAERRTPTTSDKIKAAAIEAADKARKAFGR